MAAQSQSEATSSPQELTPQALAARLGERLRAAGLIEPAPLKRAERVAEQTGESLHHVLCRLGLAHEEPVADALAEILSLPRVRATDFPAEPVRIAGLSPVFLKTAGVLPLHDGPVEGGPDAIHLAMADPTNLAAARGVSLKLGRPVVCYVATPSDLERALDRLSGGGGEHALAEMAEAFDDGGDTSADVARLRDLASGAPVIRFVDMMMRQAVEARASDIHLEPTDQGLRARIRVDGTLREIPAPPASMRAAVVSRIKIMAKLNIAERRLPQDGRAQIVVAGREIDLRVATAPSLHGEAVVMRLLDRSGVTLTFAGLGFDAPSEAAIADLIARPNGILLVTGPTGSGKTTSLYAAIGRLNGADRKIVTIEDPVEYQLAGVTQIQVKSDIGLDFASGLRSILRLDPDVIMVGEIRDGETAQIAVQAALTGHLVVATLHTNSAAAAIDRLRDMGVEDFLISATLVGAMAQRLVRRLCPHCSRPADPALARRLAPGLDPSLFREPGGCDQCGGVGYRGRTAVVEVLTMDEPARQALMARAGHREIEAGAMARGLRRMPQAALEKAARGETSLSEILRIGLEM